MKQFVLSFFLFALAIVAFGQGKPNWLHKIDPYLLEKTASGQPAQFLILLAQQADLSAANDLRTKDEKAIFVYQTLRQTAAHTQGGLLSLLAQNGADFESIFIVNAIKTSGDQALMTQIAQRPDVALLAGNPNMKMEGPVEKVTAEKMLIEWGIDMINANDVWAMGYRGQGVVVGGQDTGYDWSHPALKNAYRGYDATTDVASHSYNWHDAIHSISPLSGSPDNPCGLDSPVPCDDNSHGTHTMGTMIGLDGENEIGVAPEAQWCACRNMERGNGSPFTYLECFQWFIAPTDLNNANPDPTKAPHVVNNSWYCSESEGCNPSNWQVMNLAVNNLRFAGTVVIISAGNSGSSCGSISNPPAMFENSFAIGATAANDTIAGFSSRGPVTVDGSNRFKPNVSAPGVNVRSSVPGGGYSNFSGTSMAGPHVAGMVALIISANPDLAGQVEVIEQIIEETAVPKTTDQECGGIPGTQVPNHTYGHGRVDALAAVEAAIALIPPPPSATAEQLPMNVRVFPNPVGDKLNIGVENVQGSLRLVLFDMSGRALHQQYWSANGQVFATIEMSKFHSGIYYYRLTSQGRVVQGKVVKS